MKKENTIPKQGYALTAVTVPVTVHAVMDDGKKVEIAKATTAGQVAFVALSSTIEVSQDDAIITPSNFSAAPFGKASDGGGGVLDSLNVGNGLLKTEDGAVVVGGAIRLPDLELLSASGGVLESGHGYRGEISGQVDLLLHFFDASRPQEILLEVQVLDGASLTGNFLFFEDHEFELTAGHWKIVFDWSVTMQSWVAIGVKVKI